MQPGAIRALIRSETPKSGVAESQSAQTHRMWYSRAPLNALGTLHSHWPEYLMEAGEIASYMFLVCAIATLLLHPASPLHFIQSGFVRRVVMGLLVGSAAVGIILTPWGKQSGGHFNPAITLTFYRLGKLSLWDALFYVGAQFVGAAGGVGMASYALQGAPGTLSVRYAVTSPGGFGNFGAFFGELAISFVLMTTILFASNRRRLARYTPYLVGALYATFITFESPLSGTSMNPARTFGSAFFARYWHAYWLYLIAPTLGMFAGAEVFVWASEGIGSYCAKLDHNNNKRCIFRHGYQKVASTKLLLSRRTPGLINGE
jgi:aquaporin Z